MRQLRTIGSQLAANGVGDAEIRLGWEANNAGYPWTAVGKSAEAVEGLLHQRRPGDQGRRLGLAYRVAHGEERQDQRPTRSGPTGAPITNIGVSHYDDDEARFGMETAYGGSPWGLGAWLAFAKSKGKKLEMAEWGVGRRWRQFRLHRKMYEFFRNAGSTIGARSLPERQRP